MIVMSLDCQIKRNRQILEVPRKPSSSPKSRSRPRRFGKSLTLSMLDAMFRGKAELFKGLSATTEPHLSNLVLTLRQGSPIILEVLGVFAVFCRTESPPFFPRMGWPMQFAFALKNTHSPLDFFLRQHDYRACVRACVRPCAYLSNRSSESFSPSRESTPNAPPSQRAERWGKGVFFCAPAKVEYGG